MSTQDQKQNVVCLLEYLYSRANGDTRRREIAELYSRRPARRRAASEFKHVSAEGPGADET